MAQILPETYRLLADLIAFPSVCGRPNADIVSYIENYLRQYGITSRRLVDETGMKSSLLATIGPGDRPGIVLSAHTDVVAVEKQDWSTPPFTATVRDGRVFGRGSTDMKGFISCVLGRVPDFARLATNTPVHLAFSYDEELGCRGAPDLVHAISQLDCPPALCIVGEPTSLQIVRTHKGKIAFRISVKGRSGHSAAPHLALNAVRIAAQIASKISEVEEEIGRNSLRDPFFDPPWTSVHIGSLHGGNALNIVPDGATLEFEVRYLPGVNADDLLRGTWCWIDDLRVAMQKRAPEADITVEKIIDYPPLARKDNETAAAMIARVTGNAEVADAVSFGTEAGIYAAASIPTIVCGPGDMSRAHKANEWIGCDELFSADKMMGRLAFRLDQRISEWRRD